MATALSARLAARRRGPAGSLDALLARAPRLLRAHPRAVLVHLALEGLPDVEVVAGLRGAQALRDAVLTRARAAAPGALVAACGDAVLLLGPELDPDAVLAAVRQPLQATDRAGGPLRLVPVVRAGVARAGTGDLPALLAAASAACRHAALLGGPAPVHADERLRRGDDARLAVERLLRRAVPDGLLRLHYQPLVDLGSGAVTGAEALVRLQDDDGRLVQPAALVPVAEQTGLVVELGTWVLRETCRQLAAWLPRSPGLRSVSVNVAAAQVARPDFADVVLAALADWGLPGRVLLLELTETALLDAGPTALAALHRLRAHGVQTGVDDFGTGYAPLSTLRALPVSFVKVDRSFVAGLPGSGPDAAVVRAVLGLAADLGLDCVAEGIETPEQLEAVRRLGAVCGQGYLLSRPVPADALAPLLHGSLLPGAAPGVPQARAVAR